MSRSGQARLLRTSPDVWTADGAFLALTRNDVALLDGELGASRLGRTRLCAHGRLEDPLHEMIIALKRGSYVRPHRHEGKSESFHIIEGEGSLVLFTDSGSVTDWIALGDFASGKAFFTRLSQGVFHTLFVESARLLIHETTNGPFRSDDAIQAPWAPRELSQEGTSEYQARLWAGWKEQGTGPHNGGTK